MSLPDVIARARASGDPAPLIAAADGSPHAVLLLAWADALGVPSRYDPEALAPTDAAVLAREHLVRLTPERARLLLARADDPVLHAWAGVIEGVASPPFETLRRDARDAGRSAAVVELTALEALANASTDPAAAEALARRGVRMAATEELPESAFLANLVLARLRRLAGRPHLATHILATLRRYAPPSWRRWMAWELTLAFGRLGASLVEPEGAEARAAIERALEGDASGAPTLLRDDLRTLRALVDGGVDAGSDEAAVRAFREGRAHVVPRGLHGIAAVEAGGAAAWVVVRPGLPPTRLLSLALPRLEREGVVVLPQSHRHRGRADTLLAACALEGERGIDEGVLFAASYGFAYDAALHGGPFGVTVHRARQRVAELGNLERGEGIVRLDTRERLALPDPRCAVGTEDRALQHIALGGAASARSIAEALGVSLRSAQQALEALVREGLCGRERDGNAVVYRVEDTTFHEPTQQHALR
ncbi:MAG: helix-turn-helix transcriptional regulator [Sandaracinus sp.]|nr:helix-turn-helix transcriptional regulator [Sandaracinus sp.]